MNTHGKDYHLKLREDGRYVIADPVSDTVWHSANGFGYSTLEKARKAAAFLCQGGKEVKTDETTADVDLLDFLIQPVAVNALPYQMIKQELPEPPNATALRHAMHVIRQFVQSQAGELEDSCIYVAQPRSVRLTYISELDVYVRRTTVEEALYGKGNTPEAHGA